MRNKALSRLDPLIGVWDAASVVNGVQIMRGTMEFAWTEGGAFLVQRTRNELLDTAPDEWKEHAPRETVSMIGLDDDSLTVLYSDSRGVCRVYAMEFDGRHWTMHRQAPGFHQRFAADLSSDRQTIAGRWERSEDGQNWVLDFEVTLTRIR